MLIGNGWYSPLVQYAAYYNFTVYPGNTYDYFPFNQTVEDQMYNSMYGPGNCYDMTVDCNARGIDSVCAAADAFCANEVEEVLDIVANRDEYDIREFYPDAFPYEYYVDYLNTPAVQQAIGAYVNFSESNNAVYEAFVSTGDDDREDGTIEAVRRLVAQGVYVVQYAGDADYNCNWLGGQVVAAQVDAPGYGAAGFVNVSTSDGVVHGQVRQGGNFAFVRVYESGHEVPFYQPVLALEMFERVIAGKVVATGKRAAGPGYKTVGPEVSSFREGNATVQFTPVPSDATYNTTTGAPNPVNGTGSKRDARKKKQRSKRLFKPSVRRRS